MITRPPKFADSDVILMSILLQSTNSKMVKCSSKNMANIVSNVTPVVLDVRILMVVKLKILVWSVSKISIFKSLIKNQGLASV
jgi:hypothetical protein